MDDFSTPNTTNSYHLAPFMTNYIEVIIQSHSSIRLPLISLPLISLSLCDLRRASGLSRRWLHSYWRTQIQEPSALLEARQADPLLSPV